jgi:adhesin/invasin
MITAFGQFPPRPVRRVLLAFAAFSCLAAAACNRVALLAPAGSTITLTTLAPTLPLNGSTSIIAQVIEPAGTPPQKGTLVTFTTSLGTIQPIEAETDAGGRVMVSFNAGTRSGVATITALSGGVTTGTTGALAIPIGAASVSTVAVTASPSTIAPGAKSTITATVSDASGTLVDGVPVTFSTDNGSLTQAVVTTTANGAATTTLTTTKTAKVKASAGNATTSGETTTAAPFAEVTVTVEALPTASISASANAQVGLPVTFTITTAPGTGSTASLQSVRVDFGDGSSTSLGAAQGTTTVQHVYTTAGTKTARVTATDTNGGTTSSATVVFVDSQNPIVSLTYTSSASGGSTLVNFTATVSPSGTSVAQYVWNFGDGQSQTTFTNTVSHSYSTATLPRTATVTITTSTNRTASASTSVTP